HRPCGGELLRRRPQAADGRGPAPPEVAARDREDDRQGGAGRGGRGGRALHRALDFALRGTFRAVGCRASAGARGVCPRRVSRGPNLAGSPRRSPDTSPGPIRPTGRRGARMHVPPYAVTLDTQVHLCWQTDDAIEAALWRNAAE